MSVSAHAKSQNGQQPDSAPKVERDATPDERNAMRAYLQRTEVRLSTLHRIAIAFISGAGLLLLFPLFLKDEIAQILHVFIGFGLDQLPALADGDQVLGVVLLVLLAYPFILSAAIPLYGLYLLLKDVIHFYFTIYTPGFPGSLFTPSFVLAGVTFSPDESPDMKKQVFSYQYSSSSLNFLLPFSAEKREMYFDETVENTNGEIIPRSRKIEMLEASGALPENADHKMVERFNAAMGLARTLDRKLVEEVATTEASMVRHVLYLRRLVLRYVGTLMMFLWTTIITFLMLPFLQESRLPVFLFMSVGYLVWAYLVLPFIHVPIHWIYRHRKGQVDNRHIDRQLTVLEQRVPPYVYAAIAVSTLALMLSIVFYL